MKIEDIETLGRYNAERRRGLVHTVEWDTYMSELQQRFNDDIRAEHAEQAQRAAAAGLVPRWRRWLLRL